MYLAQNHLMVQFVASAAAPQSLGLGSLSLSEL